MKPFRSALLLAAIVGFLYSSEAEDDATPRYTAKDYECLRWVKTFVDCSERFSDEFILMICHKLRIWLEQAIAGAPKAAYDPILSPNQLEYFFSVSSCKSVECICEHWDVCREARANMKGSYASNFTELHKQMEAGATIEDDGGSAMPKHTNPERAKRQVDLAAQRELLSKFGKVIRKEIRVMSDEERSRFFSAVNQLKTETVDNMTKYDIMIVYHTAERAPEAHNSAAFLPYHREYLKNLEVALRMIDPSVSLPYWDSTLDHPLPTAADSVLWSEELYGNGDGEVVTGPFANWTVLNDSIVPDLTPSKKLVRGVGKNQQAAEYMIDEKAIKTIVAKPAYRNLVYCVEPFVEMVHGANHLFIGGHMIDLRTSPNDPAFFLVHSFVDLIWELWRQSKPAPARSVYVPDNETCNPFAMPEMLIQPFPPKIIEGLANTYLDEFYSYQARPQCTAQNACEGSPYLYCDLPNSRCLSKVRVNGNCTGYEGKDICYKSKCENGKCVPVSQQETTSAANVTEAVANTTSTPIPTNVPLNTTAATPPAPSTMMTAANPPLPPSTTAPTPPPPTATLEATMPIATTTPPPATDTEAPPEAETTAMPLTIAPATDTEAPMSPEAETTATPLTIAPAATITPPTPTLPPGEVETPAVTPPPEVVTTGAHHTPFQPPTAPPSNVSPAQATGTPFQPPTGPPSNISPTYATGTPFGPPTGPPATAESQTSVASEIVPGATPPSGGATGPMEEGYTAPVVSGSTEAGYSMPSGSGATKKAYELPTGNGVTKEQYPSPGGITGAQYTAASPSGNGVTENPSAAVIDENSIIIIKATPGAAPPKRVTAGESAATPAVFVPEQEASAATGSSTPAVIETATTPGSGEIAPVSPPSQNRSIPSGPTLNWFPITVLLSKGGNASTAYPNAKISSHASNGQTYLGKHADPNDQPYYTGAAYAAMPCPFTGPNPSKADIVVEDESGKQCASLCLDKGGMYSPCNATVTFDTDPTKSDKIARTSNLAAAKFLNWKGSERAPDKFLFLCDVPSATESPVTKAPSTGTIREYSIPLGNGKFADIVATIDEAHQIHNGGCLNLHRCCGLWGSVGECQRNLWMQLACEWSCGVCSAGDDANNETKDNSCIDNHPRCSEWADMGLCNSYSLWMEENCKKTCDVCSRSAEDLGALCGSPKKAGCRDYHADCAGWAKRGECDRNLWWMKENCPLSCKTCSPERVKSS